MKKSLVIAILAFISIIACTNRDGEIIDLINSVKKQNDDLKAQITALKKTTDSALVLALKVSSLQATTDKRIDIVQTDLKSVLSQIASISSQMIAANADLASLKTKIDALQVKCNEFVAQIALLNSSNFSTVTSKTGRIWMDRNLGASRVATSISDVSSFGDLYQWGRQADGHQLRNSPAAISQSNKDQPVNNTYIIAINEPYDWRIPQNDNLWQGTNGINNPCPNGFRLPTQTEWNLEILTWGKRNATGAFESILKLPSSGLRIGRSGSTLVDMNEPSGYYWSSTVINANVSNLDFYNRTSGSNAYTYTVARSDGLAIRCIKD
jgi:uncharacterized protein (TIGR02145 family)